MKNIIKLFAKSHFFLYFWRKLIRRSLAKILSKIIKSLTCSLIAIFIWGISPAMANNGEVKICPFATGQKMPTNQTRLVYQDHEGTIWIATFRGLVRYTDGMLRVYRSNLFTPELLPCNNVICLCEDNRQRLWIGTERGLCRLDKTTGRVVQIPIGRDSELRVNELIVTHDGSVYAGMIRGLMRCGEKRTTARRNTQLTFCRGRRHYITMSWQEANGSTPWWITRETSTSSTPPTCQCP